MKASSATFFSKFSLSPLTCLSKQVTLPAYLKGRESKLPRGGDAPESEALVKTAAVTKGHLGAHLGLADTRSCLSADFCVPHGHCLQQVLLWRGLLVVCVHLLEFLFIQRTFSDLVILFWERGYAVSPDRLPFPCSEQCQTVRFILGFPLVSHSPRSLGSIPWRTALETKTWGLSTVERGTHVTRQRLRLR